MKHVRHHHRPVLEPGRNCYAVERATGAGLLIDGHDYYGAFYRAASRAERYVLISGWQFDSGTRLLRGGEAERHEEICFLPFLHRLCEQKPGLRVFILAWDFSVVYAAEREWLQAWLFNWTTHERLEFRMDSAHPIGGAQHHKLVIVDGLLAFAGGMDVCANRWDERDHRREHPQRVDPSGKSYGPYHDVQAVLTGPVVGEIEAFFCERWRASGGGDLVLEPPPEGARPPPLEATVGIGAGPVALSRTLGATLLPPQRAVREIRQLYADAIASAERFIYAENQYFSSWAVCDALERRMRDKRMGKLDIVMVMPTQPEKPIEGLAVGNTQTKVLERLVGVAEETGHRLGIYCTAPDGACHGGCTTYIHSKLLVVDDRFFTMGSANATNRSMGLDTELNLTWEAGPDDQRLMRSIRRVRVSLLAEHTGAAGVRELLPLARARGLVARLSQMAGEKRGCRLFPRERTELPEDGPLELLAATTADPERALVEEDLFESLDTSASGLLARGLGVLSELLSSKVGG